MTIKVLIADDEILARDELTYLLNEYEEIEIIGEAKDGKEAYEKIVEQKPDVVFLDIYMPEMNGLAVAKKVMEEDINTLIVFSTAYNEHAIKAFEMNAVDYLLKPFDEERLASTIERIKKRLEKPNHEKIKELIYQMMGEDKLKEEKKNISKLAIQTDERVILLDPREIVYAYREGRGVRIKTMKDTYVTKFTLQVLEDKLKKYSFFRTHRSYLVNLDYIEELVPWFNGAYNLTMKDNEQSKVPVSRQYVKMLKDILGL
ncbi:LytR/AlgR family response regulator transcription factor [Tepidibacillus fermentans]|uniref:LytTR family two component transcriptional regulator n=1 Tax=Tepidibacillus fermentans TaxID=1281767 RepID=A0A4R3KM81_9BACI|nr:LytTR family DNA-binding domain-containing protein [Tepidibacillus fermentans]TCS84576.1 LytTR family two component transcriptional regulator [Tepidibacillus fermentans]